MRHILAFFIVGSILSCKQEPKDYASISGKITNPIDGNLSILKGQQYKKDITLNDDGTFSDTLKIEEGIYYIKHGEEFGQIYLKNNNTTSFYLDADKFDETLKFEGDNASKSNFFAATTLNSEAYLSDDSLFDVPEAEFNASIDKLKAGYDKLKEEFTDLDDTFFEEQDNEFKNMVKSYTDYYQSKLAIRKDLPLGSPSPTFDNYENYKGGTTSLSDLKGKYVYIDVWATWCAPCKNEIPFLKTLEEEYKENNIEFVSISVDNGRGYKDKSAKLAKEGWKKMIEDKQMGGIQLYSDKAWSSDFITRYKIRGIPRFILIDPNGNIVNADAPRPSSPAVKKLFNSLNI